VATCMIPVGLASRVSIRGMSPRSPNLLWGVFRSIPLRRMVAVCRSHASDKLVAWLSGSFESLSGCDCRRTTACHEVVQLAPGDFRGPSADICTQRKSTTMTCSDAGFILTWILSMSNRVTILSRFFRQCHQLVIRNCVGNL